MRTESTQLFSSMKNIEPKNDHGLGMKNWLHNAKRPCLSKRVDHQSQSLLWPLIYLLRLLYLPLSKNIKLDKK